MMPGMSQFIPGGKDLSAAPSGNSAAKSKVES